MAIINYPEYANAQHTRLFGDIGTYTAGSSPQFTPAGSSDTSDMLINWVDIDWIENYYETYNNPPTAESGWTQAHRDAAAIMRAAGFGQNIDHTGLLPEDEEYEYETFLDIEYRVHEIRPQQDTWADIIAPTTAYERLITCLRNRMHKTKVSDMLGGDIDIDGVLNNSDVTYLENIIQSVSPAREADDLKFIFDTEYSNDPTKTPQQLINRTYQIYKNSRLYGDDLDSGPIVQNDLIVLQSMLDNIFKLTLFPVDTAILVEQSATPTVTYTIRISKAPDHGNYITIWTRRKGAYAETIQGPTQQDYQHDISVTIGDLDEIDPETGEFIKNDNLITVYIYEAKSDAYIGMTDYTNPEHFNTRSYGAKLYVGTEEGRLWGDVDSNGVVNIIDAYKVLNNFKYYMGDIDKNGQIDAKDATIVLKYYSLRATGNDAVTAVEKINEGRGTNVPLSLIDIERGDVFQDGQINAADASAIMTIYSLAATGSSYEQIEQLYPQYKIITADMPLYPKTLGELSALLEKEGGERLDYFKKHSADMILESVKNCNIVLE